MTIIQCDTKVLCVQINHINYTEIINCTTTTTTTSSILMAVFQMNLGWLVPSSTHPSRELGG